MDATVVFTIAKALPVKERLSLLNMLQNELNLSKSNQKFPVKKQILTDEKAIEYLLENVFNVKKT
tara:strand:- start:1163 stop:1357 length:195 start_codon:yes stop_codon:yes gene_type:complete